MEGRFGRDIIQGEFGAEGIWEGQIDDGGEIGRERPALDRDDDGFHTRGGRLPAAGGIAPVARESVPVVAEFEAIEDSVPAAGGGTVFAAAVRENIVVVFPAVAFLPGIQDAVPTEEGGEAAVASAAERERGIVKSLLALFAEERLEDGVPAEALLAETAGGTSVEVP